MNIKSCYIQTLRVKNFDTSCGYHPCLLIATNLKLSLLDFETKKADCGRKK